MLHLAYELRQPLVVVERMTEAEFREWLEYLRWRQEQEHGEREAAD